MGPGQKLWGGVALSSDNIYAATAVGTAADICSLLADKNGEAYTASQSSGALVGGVGAPLQGHAISSPVVHDEHLFVLTATGKMKVKGGENWNNQAGTSGVPRSQIMLWEPLPDGRLPQ
jgi:type IV pilus assembly protein PilY1